MGSDHTEFVYDTKKCNQIAYAYCQMIVNYQIFETQIAKIDVMFLMQVLASTKCTVVILVIGLSLTLVLLFYFYEHMLHLWVKSPHTFKYKNNKFVRFQWQTWCFQPQSDPK